ncbi:MAG: hypothetical protein IJO56_01185 [Oscillospiraceae bacterium]|nr:hypothetical protein [Oscillospiraceae bacterium]
MCYDFEDIEYVFSYLNYTLTEDELRRSLHFFSEERAFVREHFENLSWDAPVNKQKQAIDYLATNLKSWEYIYLILAGTYNLCFVNHERRYFKCIVDKSKWENAAKVIQKIGWPRIENIVVPLFYWLLDSNWPGSETIRSLILNLPKEVLTEKCNTILTSPGRYLPTDFEDLKDIIQDITEELG